MTSPSTADLLLQLALDASRLAERTKRHEPARRLALAAAALRRRAAALRLAELADTAPTPADPLNSVRQVVEAAIDAGAGWQEVAAAVNQVRAGRG